MSTIIDDETIRALLEEPKPELDPWTWFLANASADTWSPASR